MDNSAVRIEHITKSFGTTLALNNICLDVKRGEMFGIIGPDGAGKTTLFRILTTLINADKGEAYIKQYNVKKDIKEIRSIVGYMPGRFSLYPDLTVKENLNFFASLFGVIVEDNYNIIAPIYNMLKPFSNRRASNLSGGMKQKLALSCALIHNPDIVFLDEPTTGVDAVSRREFWDMLEQLKLQGITIIVSTPYMDEASRCDRIALINQGKIMRTGNIDELTQSFPYNLYAVSSDNMYQLLKYLRDMPDVIGCYPFGAYHHLMTINEIDIERYKTVLKEKGLSKIEINALKPSIEDLFITLMK